jgi:DNA-binding transcriptional ArsR family regulator
MGTENKHKGLHFPCECVSAQKGYSDPWAAIAQNKLLPDGTKEQILCLVAREPRTIAQLAKELNHSQPSIHRHINEMVASELLRHSNEWERKYPAERYYEPNFPVVKYDDRSEFDTLCQELAERVADLFEKKTQRLESAFNKTTLPQRGWGYFDIAQYLYANVQRGARELLEGRGVLPKRKKRQNETEWIFWAEETGVQKQTPRK